MALENVQNCVVFENCVYLWNREKVVILDGENFSCVRQIGLQADQIPVPCPSVQVSASLLSTFIHMPKKSLSVLRFFRIILL